MDTLELLVAYIERADSDMRNGHVWSQFLQGMRVGFIIAIKAAGGEYDE